MKGNKVLVLDVLNFTRKWFDKEDLSHYREGQQKYTEQMYLAKIIEKLPKNYAMFLKREIYRFRDDISEDYIKCVGSGFIKDLEVLFELIMFSKKQKRNESR